MHHHDDTETCVEQLRTALEAHGITLPSLTVGLPTFAGAHAGQTLIPSATATRRPPAP